MLYKLNVILLILISLGVKIAQASPLRVVNEKTTAITLTHEQILSFATDLIAQGKLDDARKVLLLKPYNDKELEIERLYLLAQIATLEHKYNEAIDI